MTDPRLDAIAALSTTVLKQARDIRELRANNELKDQELKRLWGLLDDISTAGDAFKPREEQPYFNYVNDKCEDRHGMLKSDGFDLFIGDIRIGPGGLASEVKRLTELVERTEHKYRSRHHRKLIEYELRHKEELKALRKTLHATVPVGYHDGLMRDWKVATVKRDDEISALHLEIDDCHKRMVVSAKRNERLEAAFLAMRQIKGCQELAELLIDNGIKKAGCWASDGNFNDDCADCNTDCG